MPCGGKGGRPTGRAVLGCGIGGPRPLLTRPDPPQRIVKGLSIFLRETWWVFGGAAVLTCVMAWLTGWWLYLVFLPALVVIAVYMSAVRYDRDGNLREQQRR